MYSVGIFALAKQSSLFDYLGRLKFIKDVSALSFGIYILHTTVLNVLNKSFKLYPDYFMPIVGELIFAVVAFVGAYVMTALCRRIPILGRYL